MTGAMHEDGLADCADGFWGGWTRTRRLEIMKDSRIGAYGVLALILAMGLRWQALILALPLGMQGWGLWLAAQMLSRALMARTMATQPHARPGGLAASGTEPSGGASRSGPRGIDGEGACRLPRRRSAMTAAGQPAGPEACMAGGHRHRAGTARLPSPVGRYFLPIFGSVPARMRAMFGRWRRKTRTARTTQSSAMSPRPSAQAQTGDRAAATSAESEEIRSAGRSAAAAGSAARSARPPRRTAPTMTTAATAIATKRMKRTTPATASMSASGPKSTTEAAAARLRTATP